MKERARSLNGEVEIRSDGDGGTTVAFSLFRDALSANRCAMGIAR